MPPKNMKHVAKETAFVGMALICMLAMILVTSIAETGMDFKKVLSQDNLSNVLINVSITVFGTLAAVPLGSAGTKQRINPDGTHGRYLQEFHAYNKIRQKIESRITMFGQWHHEQFLKEHRAKCVNYLLERNIVQAEDILHLSREQLVALTEPQHYDVEGVTVYFRALSPLQIQACLKVYDGKISVHKLPDFYFLYIDGKGKRTFYDQAYYESRDENYSLISNLIYRVFIGFTITCIFTGLVLDFVNVEDFTAAYIAQMLLTVFTRVFNAASSIFWGYMAGQEFVYKQCYYINGKTQFLQAFDSDKEFVFKDIRQITKEEYLKTQERSSDSNGQSESKPDSVSGNSASGTNEES